MVGGLICKEKYIYIVYIFFETTEQIKIKLDRNDVWKVLYKHSSFHFDKTKNMAFSSTVSLLHNVMFRV
jgi:hypothetical protein